MSDKYPYEDAIIGDYRLIRGLGHGGFADVYLGRDITLGKSVAVKVINTKFPRQQQIEKFEREARIVASLEHRHIIEVYRYGVVGNVPYIVMKYAPNGSVRHKHPRGTLLTLETIVAYVHQVAEALQYAHDKGLIHRDVTPGNMLFGSFGEILLSDFGIAILTDSRRVDPQDIGGTLTYMAPEQFEAKAVRQSDQYSLGIAVYEWLTGDVPFHGKTIYEAAVQHKCSPVPAMQRLGMAIPHEIEAIILKALAKDPLDRFKTITAFAQALEAAIHKSNVTPTVGAKLWTYRENEAEVLSVVWSADGSRIVTGNRNGTDRAIDGLTGQTAHLHPLEKVSVGNNRYVVRVNILGCSETNPDYFDELFELLKSSKQVNVAISNGCDESGSLAITGLRQSLFQRWNAIVDPTAREHDQGVFIAWDADCKKYLDYYEYSIYQYEDRMVDDFEPYNQVRGLLYYLWMHAGEEIPPGEEIPRLLIDVAAIALHQGTAFAWSRLAEAAATANKKEGLVIIDLSNSLTYHSAEEKLVNALAWSPQDRVLATGTDDGHITIRTVEGINLLSMKVSSNRVNAIAWNPDGTQIAIAHRLEVSVYQVK